MANPEVICPGSGLVGIRQEKALTRCALVGAYTQRRADNARDSGGIIHSRIAHKRRRAWQKTLIMREKKGTM